MELNHTTLLCITAYVKFVLFYANKVLHVSQVEKMFCLTYPLWEMLISLRSEYKHFFCCDCTRILDSMFFLYSSS